MLGVGVIFEVPDYDQGMSRFEECQESLPTAVHCCSRTDFTISFREKFLAAAAEGTMGP